MNTRTTSRKPRADVVRNRARILEAAETHFLTQGVAASLEAVAKEAGIGVATLYRHFPTREALLAGLLNERRDELEKRQRRIDNLEDPGEALRRWLRALEDYLSLYNGLSEPLVIASKTSGSSNPLTRSCADLITSTGDYLEAARAAGQARDGIDGRDLFMAVSSVAWVRNTRAADDAALARLRSIVESGYGRTGQTAR
ncbi:TetR/AcrR family transcriptional regulator [Nocardioides sp. NPDC051685]|uniref:TetR/AcrR family transcriptional regulator n=1 Tax=Nocardioides sp. NPDC051685 TaxID=3364334 RepID=UPI0037BCC84D